MAELHGVTEVDGDREVRGVTGVHRDLVDHLVRSTQMPPGMARRVVDDVVAYFGEPSRPWSDAGTGSCRRRAGRTRRSSIASPPS